jgi:hypothetical protein
MKKIIGTTRIVLAFPSVGLALKFPRIRIGSVLHVFRGNWLRGTFWQYIAEDLRCSSEIKWSIRGLLFAGIAANLSERRFWRRTKHRLIQPTHLSIFGLLNVQRYGEPCEPNLDVWRQFVEIIGDDVWKDCHHFESSKNFCRRDGHLSMVDYGSRPAREIILKHGLEILRRFDLSRRMKPSRKTP